MHYLFGCWLVNKAIIVQVSTYVDKFGSNLPKVPRSTHTLIQFWGPGTTQSSMTIGSFMDRVNISTQVDDVETGSSIPRYYNFLNSTPSSEIGSRVRQPKTRMLSCGTIFNPEFPPQNWGFRPQPRVFSWIGMLCWSTYEGTSLSIDNKPLPLPSTLFRCWKWCIASGASAAVYTNCLHSCCITE
jgi:hypothetical protein